jgi:hypothetical protein
MTTTITLSKTGSLVTVTANGETIATVKDGGNLIGRTDRHLTAAKIHRATGYTVTDAGMVATGADLR